MDDWLTPKEIVDALGKFDLDPCAPVHRTQDTATNHFSTLDNGLTKEWVGRVWLHPPLKNIDLWIGKMAEYGSGVCMTFVASNEKWFHEHVLLKAHSIFFIDEKIRLHRGMADVFGAPEQRPMCLIAWAEADSVAIGEALTISGTQLYLGN